MCWGVDEVVYKLLSEVVLGVGGRDKAWPVSPSGWGSTGRAGAAVYQRTPPRGRLGSWEGL